MKSPIRDGRCRLYAAQAHCQWCRTHAEWRAQGGFPEACPHGITAETAEAAARQRRPRPGKELKKILLQLGVKESPTCACNAMAAKMDANGVEWCEQHIPEIVAVMEQEAQKRGWLRLVPFKRLGAAALVRMAISKAKGIDSTRSW